ncbi:hypothetical protein [uncultured Boseongicola sp.]
MTLMELIWPRRSGQLPHLARQACRSARSCGGCRTGLPTSTSATQT